ncbi:large subunit ribosomal protein L10Ae [Nematocida sp. AWRm77]|nr:large subunit ribosomal protein L10Ae [Nematocida sp. AWRm77]
MDSTKVFGVEKLIPVVTKVFEGIKEKKIEQGETVEMRVRIKGYDPKKDKMLKGEITLPFQKRTQEKVLIIADAPLERALQGTDLPYVLMETYKGKSAEEKKARKKLIKKYHSFISVVSVYKVFEPRLFAGNKKPVYMIKNISDIKNFYEETTRKLQLNLKDDLSFGFSIGSTKMAINEVAQNISTAMISMVGLAKKGMQNIRSVYIKSTQGSSIQYY